MKAGGIVYAVIPNRRFTYDSKRSPTPVERMIRRFKERNFSLDEADALDVVQNTTGHPLYENRSREYALEILARRDGTHHFFVFDESNTVEMLANAQTQFPARLAYFACEGGNIHFALRRA